MKIENYLDHLIELIHLIRYLFDNLDHLIK
jgi:hypothetical protein